MRVSHSSRPLWRHISINTINRHITTGAVTFAEVRNELLHRPSKTYSDLLGRSSWMLAISLPDLHPVDRKKRVRLRMAEDEAVLPQGHHLLYFRPTHSTNSLLADGTDPDHSPGAPFTRRLWAGGSVAFTQGWKSGLRLAWQTPWVCRECITGVRLKDCPPGHETEGTPGLGHKILVDVERQYSVKLEDKELPVKVIVERRTLCFMAPRTSEDIQKALEKPIRKSIRAPQTPKEDSDSSYFQSFTLTPAALFRFSALTFNAHKIHFDPQHCREVEGYPDLLVHGPLLLLLMFSVLNSRGHIVDRLDYKNLAPVYVDEEIKVCVQQRKENWSVWIAGPQGDLRVKATAVLEPRAAQDGGMFQADNPERGA